MFRLNRCFAACLTLAASLAASSAFAGASLKNAAMPPGGTAQIASGEVASAQGGGSAPRIAPIDSRPYGKTYREWAAEWWQWGLQTPAGANPLTDPSGENCTAGQHGKVWFLAGNPFSILGPGPVTRDCSVPRHTALLFPIVNNGYFAFLSDPPETRTREFCRQQVEGVKDQQSLTLKIDGKVVGNLRKQFERSAIFDVQLPAENILGLSEAEAPGLLLRPSCDAGYYVFLFPLAPGSHVLAWAAPSGSQDITYNLTVH